MTYELADAFDVDRPIDQTWAFFSKAENLPAITPPWMRFRIVTPQPIEIREGTLLDYTIRVSGVPVKWRTRIIEWTPPRQFVDLQLSGPYTLWHHQHTFASGDDGRSTRCRDRVTYRIPFGPIGRLAHAVMVRRQLLEIFTYRREAIGRLLGPVRPIEDVTIRALG